MHHPFLGDIVFAIAKEDRSQILSHALKQIRRHERAKWDIPPSDFARVIPTHSFSDGKMANERWLRDGDNNTKFYHRVATARNKRSGITELRHDKTIANTEDSMRMVCLNFFRKSLESAHTQLISLNWGAGVLFPEQLSGLDVITGLLTEDEVLGAIRSLGKDKTPGPDGLIVEFFISTWNIIRHDFRVLLDDLIFGNADWAALNKAFIALIPKVQPPSAGTMAMEHSRSERSLRGSLREIVGEPTESPTTPQETLPDEDRVYVALEKDIREARANLMWALQNTSDEKKIVIVHVHRPAQKIPTALGWFPANQLQEQEVNAYRKIERGKMHKCLDEYVNLCSHIKIRKVEKLVIEKDDVSKGLVELIALHGITKLVMGAAADRHCTRKMRAPKSKTALAVQQQADPSCKIWFVCKGNLICTRDASLGESGIVQSLVQSLVQSPTGSPNSISNQSEMQRSRSLYQAQGDPLLNLSSLTAMTQELFTQNSGSGNFSRYTELTMTALPNEGLVRSPISGSREVSAIDPWDAISRDSDHSVLDDVPIMPKDVDRDNEVLTLPSMHEEDHLFQSPQHELQVLSMDDIMHERLEAAFSEAENSRREAYEEFYKRQKAEKDLNEAMRKVRAAETLYTKEVKLRKEIEETLAAEENELSALRQRRDEGYEELQKAQQRMTGLQLHVSDTGQILKDIKGKLSESYTQLNSIRIEHGMLRQEPDNAIGENEELCPNKGDATASIYAAENFSEFSLLEVENATENFHDSSKIGDGGYGCVYKGFLRHSTVAIKRLDPQGMQRKTEFCQEIEFLSRVRHPNLVTLIGACPEAWTLVCEFLPNGNLEDLLTCMRNTPLTWQARIRIAAEICSALNFLHSCKPLSIVHGDLKPANILFDANYVSKLGDFGICRLLVQSINSIILYHCTRQPEGTFAYMDPELLSSGVITTKSDVYSFGVILLRLLTGKPAFGISRAVQDALDTKSLDKILDVSAGDWPYVQAEKLAKLGLKCCEMNGRNRPDAEEAWKMLEPLMKFVSFERLSTPSFRSVPEDSSRIPSYFICPIFKELMKDPQMAADGFTYEAEAIKGWLSSGRDTSPMTNLRLSHHDLIPNFALRSAIQGWLQQQI
ncbi:hypothetical protein Cni_G03576 [Canna indica]|uniref:RING-type E3 ubiquitin transferase n=1 Tax=Canna indica TaxID=4628 RepID=A0AAQ3JU56_9LILI|nr:hypothetical protein Cni_G03576 [Canna indica]